MRLSIVKHKGFTIVEMMIVIVIIGIMTAMVAVGYRSGQKQLALQRASFKLAQDIRFMQTRALAASRVNECFELPPNDDEPKFSGYQYGFGIHFEKNDAKYILFADCKPDGKFNPSDGDYPVDAPDLNIIEIGDFYGPSDTRNKLDIVFTPPNPNVSLRLIGPDKDISLATIVLRVKTDASKTKNVVVNKAGLIYTE